MEDGEIIIPYWHRTEFLELPERALTLGEIWAECEKEGEDAESNWVAKFKWLKGKEENPERKK